MNMHATYFSLACASEGTVDPFPLAYIVYKLSVHGSPAPHAFDRPRHTRPRTHALAVTFRRVGVLITRRCRTFRYSQGERSPCRLHGSRSGGGVVFTGNRPAVYVMLLAANSRVMMCCGVSTVTLRRAVAGHASSSSCGTLATLVPLSLQVTSGAQLRRQA